MVGLSDRVVERKESRVSLALDSGLARQYCGGGANDLDYLMDYMFYGGPPPVPCE